jgi:hypothetical protein
MMRWMNLLLPAAAGAFLVTASCSRNKDTEEVTPESQPSAAAPAADTTNTAAAAGAAVDSTAAMADSTAGAVQDSVTQPMDTSMAPHDSM